jgi:hypothetical protein
MSTSLFNKCISNKGLPTSGRPMKKNSLRCRYSSSCPKLGETEGKLYKLADKCDRFTTSSNGIIPKTNFNSRCSASNNNLGRSADKSSSVGFIV